MPEYDADRGQWRASPPQNEILSPQIDTFAANARDALLRAANEHHQAQRYNECESALRRALAIDGSNASAWHVLAVTRHRLGSNTEAIELLRRAIALEPASARFQKDLAVLLRSVGSYEEALEAIRRSLAQVSDDAVALNIEGYCLSELGRPAEAMRAYHRALARDPKYVECWTNLAYAWQQMLQLDRAQESFHRALALSPDYAPARCGAAILALLRGDYTTGFAQLEWRWRLETIKPRYFKQPAWQGQRLDGKTMLLHAEQGLGDTIQFLRFVPDVIRSGARVLLEVPEVLQRLAASLDCDCDVVSRGQPLPSFDVHCPLVSLPHVLGVTLADLPARIAYLRADPAAIARWSRRLCAGGDPPKIGIVWAGNPKHPQDRYRSIAPERLASLLERPGIRFYSLQKTEQASLREVEDKFIDIAPELLDLAETAAALLNLDLVITVDTATAHLAGALGRPCWVLLPFMPDWRWLLERTDSPWYPTLRLFRQSAPGDWDSAIKLVRDALSIWCDEQRSNRQPRIQLAREQRCFDAIELLNAGREAEAEATLRAILDDDPSHVAALTQLGRICLLRGAYVEAKTLLLRLIECAPANADAHCNLGLALSALGRHDEAQASCRRGLALNPASTEAHNTYAAILKAAGRYDEAEAHYRRAFELDNSLPHPLNNIGALFAERGELNAAIEWYRRAIEKQPTFALAHDNLGAALTKLGRPEEAAAFHKRAIALRPGFAQAHYNLGVALQEQGRIEEALASYNEAVEMQPDMVDARWNRAVALLTLGSYPDGWREHEWRWRRREQPPREFDQPLWRGEELNGKSIILHAEQGIGDTLQFIRYVPLVAARGAHVIVAVQPSLLRLVSGSLGNSVDVKAATDPLPLTDVHCPLMSLPFVLGTTLQSIPVCVPYIKADPFAVERWRNRLNAAAPIKVGLVWAGRSQHKNDANRSISLERLMPLFGIDNARWFSLQVGDRKADLSRIPSHLITDHLITDLSGFLSDFSETAAALMCLDLVITVDTAVAHLAGALGKTVWVMLPFVSDWRWLIARDDSPWYPTARLFRQQQRGDWGSVVERLHRALVEFVGSAQPRQSET
jgi:tetratricopeptide (TPR) repeat protein